MNSIGKTIILLAVLLAVSQFTLADTVYLNTTQNTLVGGTDFKILGNSGAAVDTNTRIRPRDTGWDYAFDPQTTGMTTSPRVAPASVNTVAPLYGWATLRTYTGTIPAGAWLFDTETQSATNAGTVYLYISVWKTCGPNLANTWLFTASNSTDITVTTPTIRALETRFNAPEITLGEDCALKVGYYAYTQAGTGGTSTVTFRSNTAAHSVIFPAPFRKIISVSLDSPSTDLIVDPAATFAMACTGITDNSTNGLNVEYQYNTSTAGFAAIPTVSGELTVAANPETNVRNNSQVSEIVTASTPGDYYIRCRLYNATNSVYSQYRKITVRTPITISPTNLDIWDPTKPKGGSQTVIAGDSATFYANYTNASNGAALSAANCQIGFSDQGFAFNAMSYNATSKLFEFPRTFAAAGAFQYNVSCTLNNYQPQSLLNSITISPAPFVAVDKPAYSACGIVYFEAKAYDKNEQLFTGTNGANVSIAGPGGTAFQNFSSFTSGILRGSYQLPVSANPGNWLIKVLSGALGRKEFYVRSGNADVWKININFGITKGAYDAIETVPVSFDVLNLKGMGVSNLVPNNNLLLYRDNSAYSPAITNHNNGTYSFALDFAGLSTGAAHTLSVIANANSVNVTSSRGFYVQ